MSDCSDQPLGCIQHAADILGSKWTGQIIGELTTGSKRFCELERALPTLNPRTLSKRLGDLETDKIIVRHADSQGYSLTSRGNDLLPILREMAKWDARHPASVEHA